MLTAIKLRCDGVRISPVVPSDDFMPSSHPFPPQPEQRLLAAIVFTDVAGFSRRVQVAEAVTLKLLERDFATMRAFAAMHAGRVVKSTGDGLLIFFTSAVQAVEWALKVQRHFADQAGSLETEEVLRHRVGVHLGDVVIQGGDVMGDGVNIAARVQAHAPPGGICISQDVYGVVKNKLKLDVVHLEPRHLKNIKEAVQMYHVLLEPLAETTHPVFRPIAAATEAQKQPLPAWKKWAAGFGMLALMGVVAAVLVQAHRDHQQQLAGSQGLREALGTIARHDQTDGTQAKVEVAPTPVVVAKGPPAPVKKPTPAAAPGAADPFDFARLTAGRPSDAAATEQDKRALQAARECLPTLDQWVAAGLQRYTRDQPLHVIPFRSRGFHSASLFTENGQLHFAEGGATMKANWAELSDDRRGAIITSLLRSASAPPPREVVRAAEAFAFVHRLPEMADTLLREHRGK
jgi:class 3 adenylate cyclase